MQFIIISTKKYIFSLLVPWSHYKQFTWLQKKGRIQSLVLIFFWVIWGLQFWNGPRNVPTFPIG